MQFIRLIYWISLLYFKSLDEPQELELSREVRSDAHGKLAEGGWGDGTNQEEYAKVDRVLAGRPELRREGRMLRGSTGRWDETQTSENSAGWSRTLNAGLPKRWTGGGMGIILPDVSVRYRVFSGLFPDCSSLDAHAHYWWAVAVTEFHSFHLCSITSWI